MKYLLALLILTLLWAVPVDAAVMWNSYSDSARTITSDNFMASGAVVFMKGTGLAGNKAYMVRFYDADPAKYPEFYLEVDAGSTDKNGNFITAQIQPCQYPESMPGLWRAELYRVQPETLVGTDTFTVQGSAIPEFENVFTGIIICGIFSSIYLLVGWLTKRTCKHQMQ